MSKLTRRATKSNKTSIHWTLLDNAVQAVKRRNKGVSAKSIDDRVAKAVAEIRQERRSPGTQKR